ncbi:MULTISPECIES: FUSC family protein [Streptomyces]|uniref:FUSC family protein n=1 Tax=Streptomyces TaxID=1883 RepID=UPI00103CAB9A|nr:MULTISPECIES: FUSC family protein [Streptomyces]MBT3077875.1 FUSC family protein [Streptomyces sp. COG21]MBT3084718.1 FUSC family protein [Streptomyces sp. COG20]MBT3085558.1 FUSC family protein [Streptomyces sp. CYG21]MBT3100161.1 FUSC family protein [Streptomyces sp. CBG30]MBT3103333.1 FUSC family protein [Streptomyces sp. COG19]
MLKRVFVAPDPGRVRLRFASRAVIGVGLAVVLCGLVGHSLVAAITGGLAALLALFTVTDATVRQQAVTTALLPAAGLPVLAVAALLHDQPLARDLVFLAVMGAGVYARRWGPRGHALGIFAFMTFFAAQFLHTVPGQLPELYAAVLLSLAASAAVRFGLWCYERRLPAVAVPVPAPPEGRGLARITTRQAVQATLGGAFALGLGQVLSDQRWYWAVGATWWVFVNTTSRGETLVRGFRRVLGTVVGIAAGFFIAIPLEGAGAPTAAIVAVCVFGIFYTAAVSYSWMMCFVTVMVGVLYGVLGVLDASLLWLRVAETAVGALGAVLAVLLVLPVTTHAVTDAWIRKALRCVHACTAEAAERLAGSLSADPAPRVAELDVLLGRVRLSLAPLVHPLSPLKARKARARQVLALLDDCVREVRGLASIAADPAASHDARLSAACSRVEEAVEELLRQESRQARGAGRAAVQPAAAPDHPALAHLHGLERALGDLAAPLHSSPRAPIAA